MLGDVEETIYIVSDDEDDDTVRVCKGLGLKYILVVGANKVIRLLKRTPRCSSSEVCWHSLVILMIGILIAAIGDSVVLISPQAQS